MKILIGELKQTSGNIYINGFDLNENYTQARKNLG
jgi:ABC-type multidrug transport system ATPase subunit